QDVVVRSDDGHLTFPGRAVTRHVFPKSIMIANLCSGHPALPLQILRLKTNARERKDFIVLPKLCVSPHHNMRVQPAVGAHNNILSHDTIGSDLATGPNLRLGMNDGSRMNHGWVAFTSLRRAGL